MQKAGPITIPLEAGSPSSFLTPNTITQKNSLAYSPDSAYHDPMPDKKKKKSASLGCLFWIAFILLVLILFFLKRDTISSVLEKTGIADTLFRNKTVTIESDEPAIPSVKKTDGDEQLLIVPAPEPAAESEAEPAEPQKTESPKSVEAAEKPAPAKEAEPKPVPEKNADRNTDTKPAAAAEKPAAKPSRTPAEKPVPQRKAQLWFVVIDGDGRVLRKQVAREVPKTDSPLADSLASLFSGPNAAEEKKGFRTLIPPGTKLLSATVKDGVATLNFNDAFQFNQFGIEGFIGQLAQIVFTATEFPTVVSVQILIEGQRKEYLGGEGVWIGTPLSRDKF